MSTVTATEPTQGTHILGEDIDARVDELFAANGYAKTDDDGDIVRDKDKVVERITEVLVADAVASNNDERVAKALSKEALYDRIFGYGPRLDDPEEIEHEVARYAAIYAWSLTAPSYQGRVQRKLAEVAGADDLVLCRRKIGGAPSVYVTRSHDLIVDDFVTPASEKLVKTADKTRRDMALAVSRQKGLEPRVTAELQQMAAKTSLALGASTSAPALGSGS